MPEKNLATLPPYRAAAHLLVRNEPSWAFGPYKLQKGGKLVRLSEIKIDVTKTLGSHFWLVEVTPTYEYKDGVRTDNLVGYRYTVTLPEKNFEKIGVRIPGAPVVTEINGYVEVKFHGLEVTPYQSGRDISFSAKAESIEILEKKG